MAMTRQLWSISAAAVELGRDRRTIAAALSDVPEDGKINDRTKGWHLPTIMAALGGGPKGDAPDLNEERARLAKEQADKLEMENALKRRELFRREDVDAAVTGAFARLRARLLNVPTKVAPTVLPEEPLVAERAIRTAIYEALRELSETSVADLCGDDDGVVEDTGASAGTDGQPMGGS